MKTKNLLIGLTALLFLIGFVTLTSCEKDKELSAEAEEIADDQALIDNTFESIGNEIDAAEAFLSSDFKAAGDTCPLIKAEQVGDTTVITIDFGGGCYQYVYRYGKIVDTIVRKGQIIVKRQGRFREQNSFRIVTLKDFYINGIKIEATRTIQNMGRDQQNRMYFRITVQNGKITTPDGIVMTCNSERYRYWVKGEFTSTPWDDEFAVVGNAEGVAAFGESYQLRIIDTLRLQLACRFAVQGKVEAIVGNREPVTIDYGNGECDNVATVSCGGASKQIVLRFRAKERAKRILGK